MGYDTHPKICPVPLWRANQALASCVVGVVAFICPGSRVRLSLRSGSNGSRQGPIHQRDSGRERDNVLLCHAGACFSSIALLVREVYCEPLKDRRASSTPKAARAWSRNTTRGALHLKCFYTEAPTGRRT